MNKINFGAGVKFKTRYATTNGQCETPCVAPPTDRPPILTTTPKHVLSGINGIIFRHCSSPHVNIADEAEWQSMIDAGLLFGRLGCLFEGSKAKGSPTTIERGACPVKIATTVNDVYTLNDVGNDDQLSMNDFYCWLKKYWNQYEIAFTTCDGRLRDFKKPSFFAADDIETTTNAGLYEWGIDVEFLRSADSCCKMYKLPFLAGLTNALQTAPNPVP